MKAIICVVVTIFFTCSSIAQDSVKIIPESDIGLRVSVGSQNQISFDYRKYLKNELKLVFGVGFLNSSNFRENTQVISASSNSVIFEQFYENAAGLNLRAGIEKSLKKWPNLYGGVHLLAGYQQKVSQYSTYQDTLNENGNWETVFIQEEPFSGLSSYKNHFISTGAMLAAGWDVSISERFIFNLNVSQTFEALFQVGPSDVEPTGSYPGRIIVFNAHSRLGLGIRYTL